MKVELSSDKKSIVITLPLQKGKPSASGKTVVVATTGGNQQTAVNVEDKPVVVGVNVYYKP